MVTRSQALSSFLSSGWKCRLEFAHMYRNSSRICLRNLSNGLLPAVRTYPYNSRDQAGMGGHGHVPHHLNTYATVLVTAAVADQDFD